MLVVSKRFLVLVVVLLFCLALPGMALAASAGIAPPGLITDDYTITETVSLNQSYTVAKDKTLGVADSVYANIYGDLTLFGKLNIAPTGKLKVSGALKLGPTADKEQITQFITEGKLVCSQPVDITDIIGPRIVLFTPGANQQLKGTANIALKAVDETGININQSVITFDGKVLPGKQSVLGGNTMVFNYKPAQMFDGPHKVTATLIDIYGNKTEYSWFFTVDNPGPKITAVTPVNYSTVYRRPVITAKLADTWADVNWSSVKVLWDGKTYTKAAVKGTTITLSPAAPFGNGAHKLVLSLVDKRGNFKSLTWNIAVTTPYIKSVPTGMWIEVNQKTQRVYVMKGNQVVKEIICSTGMPDTPTPNGIFKVQNRGPWFTTREKTAGARHWVSFKGWGKYMFHSVIYNYRGTYIIRSAAAKLGNKASHGCIRLPLNEAKWLYDTIPANSLVVIHEPK